MSFYWTPTKNSVPKECVVCGNYYGAGFLNPKGEFFCSKDQLIRDREDISIGRISVWSNEDIPTALVTELLGQVDQFVVEHTKWWALFPPEILSAANSFADNFEMLSEYSTSFGMIYALAPREK